MAAVSVNGYGPEAAFDGGVTPTLELELAPGDRVTLLEAGACDHPAGREGVMVKVEAGQAELSALVTCML